MNLGAVLMLGGVAIVAIAALFYLGMRLARAIEKKAPPEARANITPTGLALAGCMTATLVVFAVAATLEPEGPLGSFLRRPEGLLAALVAAVVFFSLVAWLFERIGYPISRSRKNG
jgi:hypothetical protein